MEEHKKGQF